MGKTPLKGPVKNRRGRAIASSRAGRNETDDGDELEHSSRSLSLSSLSLSRSEGVFIGVER